MRSDQSVFIEGISVLLHSNPYCVKTISLAVALIPLPTTAGSPAPMNRMGKLDLSNHQSSTMVTVIISVLHTTRLSSLVLNTIFHKQ